MVAHRADAAAVVGERCSSRHRPARPTLLHARRRRPVAGDWLLLLDVPTGALCSCPLAAGAEQEQVCAPLPSLGADMRAIGGAAARCPRMSAVLPDASHGRRFTVLRAVLLSSPCGGGGTRARYCLSRGQLDAGFWGGRGRRTFVTWRRRSRIGELDERGKVVWIPTEGRSGDRPALPDSTILRAPWTWESAPRPVGACDGTLLFEHSSPDEVEVEWTCCDAETQAFAVLAGSMLPSGLCGAEAVREATSLTAHITSRRGQGKVASSSAT